MSTWDKSPTKIDCNLSIVALMAFTFLDLIIPTAIFSNVPLVSSISFSAAMSLFRWIVFPTEPCGAQSVGHDFIVFFGSLFVPYGFDSELLLSRNSARVNSAGIPIFI